METILAQKAGTPSVKKKGAILLNNHILSMSQIKIHCGNEFIYINVIGFLKEKKKYFTERKKKGKCHLWAILINSLSLFFLINLLNSISNKSFLAFYVYFK